MDNNEQKLVEQLAKALWDSERKEGDAKWPKDSRRQPYCQSTYREVETLLPTIRSHTDALVAAAVEECAKLVEPLIRSGINTGTSGKTLADEIRSLAPGSARRALELREVKARLEEAKQEDWDSLSERITQQIQSLLTDKYTNSFLIAHNIITQELKRIQQERIAELSAQSKGAGQ